MTSARNAQATFWRNLFKERPDLNPPGYNETLRRLGYKVEEEPSEDCEIEF